jgi:hypothetical protein
LRRQSERRAVPAAVPKLAVPALCKPVGAQFVERSCAGPVVVEQPALPQPGALAERPRKPQVRLVKTSQPADLLAALEEQQSLMMPRAPIPLVGSLRAWLRPAEPLETQEAESPSVPLLQEAQPS